MSTIPSPKTHETSLDSAPEATTGHNHPNKVIETTAELGPKKDLCDDVIRVLKTCYDPEIPINIYELGLVYKVEVEELDSVVITMTLTSPNCPAAESLPMEIEKKVKQLPGIKKTKVNVVWEPMWDKNMMSQAAQLQLGLL
jgi:FeS assembly SUF system protein